MSSLFVHKQKIDEP